MLRCEDGRCLDVWHALFSRQRIHDLANVEAEHEDV